MKEDNNVCRNMFMKDNFLMLTLTKFMIHVKSSIDSKCIDRKVGNHVF